MAFPIRLVRTHYAVYDQTPGEVIPADLPFTDPLSIEDTTPQVVLAGSSAILIVTAPFIAAKAGTFDLIGFALVSPGPGLVVADQNNKASIRMLGAIAPAILAEISQTYEASVMTPTTLAGFMQQETELSVAAQFTAAAGDSVTFALRVDNNGPGVNPLTFANYRIQGRFNPSP